MHAEIFDAIVVGSGATGGWAAMALTEGGLRVLVLEAGPRLGREDSGVDPEWRDRRPVQSLCDACDETNARYFVEDEAHPYASSAERPFRWIRGRQLGGRTWVWKGHAYRMSDAEFKAASRDGVGDDWPIGYEDLSPYYDKVERLLGVCGAAEAIPHLPDGSFAPARMGAADRFLRDAVALHLPDRRVISARLAAPPPGGRDGFDGPSASSAETTLRAAEHTGRLELRTGAVARRVLARRGAAQGIEYFDLGTKEVRRAHARMVFLCAGAIESTRLLLNSASPDHPRGLGSSSGVLGRYLMDHVHGPFIAGSAPAVSGYSEDEDDWASPGLYIPRFRNVAAPDGRFVRGYGIQGRVHPWLGPAHVREMPGDFEENRRMVLGAGPPARFWFRAFGEMLPESHNRVELDGGRLDAFGVPTVRITCVHSENDRAMWRDMIGALQELARAAGLQVEVERTDLDPPGSAVHELGTARMGSDPGRSVLDPRNRVWDAPNIYVTDGSCFVTSGYQNPTLTMMAITARACDDALARFRRLDL